VKISSQRRRGQIFTLRILGVSKKRPVSHPRLSALVTDTRDAAGIARAYVEHRYTQRRRGQIFTLRILGVSKKRPVSHPRLSALVTDTKDAAGIARAYLEHHYTRPPVPAEGSYAGSRTTNSPASAG
jgi:hypothetical protein